jgi:hypothetical protein
MKGETMQTHSLFEQPVQAMPSVPFAGAEYNEVRDRERLTTQIERVRELMNDGAWRTVERISSELRRAYPAARFPEASISAQLRNLRKIGFTVETRNISENGLLYEYRLVVPVNPGVAQTPQKASGVHVG